MSYKHPKRKTKVVFVQLGSPSEPTTKALRKYLRDFLGDPRVVDINPWLWKIILNFFVLPFRPKKSAKLYARIWDGKSFPLITNTRDFTKNVSEELKKIDPNGYVEVNHAFLLSPPYVNEVYDSWEEDLKKGIVPVITGFQGINESGDITTLGRGGSDTSAVALAVALKAHECQIYTDVDGVYTTDPRVYDRAKKIDKLSFEEMLELSSLGAKVLQIRSVEFASKFNMPVRVLSSFNKGEGTLIDKEDENLENALISGVTHTKSDSKLIIRQVPDLPGIAAKILSPVSNEGIEVDVIVQNVAEDKTTDFTFTVKDEDAEKAAKILKELSDELGGGNVELAKEISKVSVVGVGMKSHAGVATKMFTALADKNINIDMISTSEIKISVVVSRENAEEAVKALHDAFELG